MDMPKKYLPSGLSVDCLCTAFVNRYEPNFTFRGESHEAWELSCFLDGEGGVTSGTEVYRCVAGDMVIHPPHRFHTFWTDDGEEACVLTVSFMGEGTSHFVPKGKFSLTDTEPLLVELLTKEIQKTYQGILPRDCHRPAEDEQIVKGLLETLLLSLHRRRGETEQVAEGGRASRFAQIAAYLRAHVCEPLDVTRICADCHVSRSTLKDLFRRYTGAGVMQYLHSLRLRHACKLLKTDRSMADIAAEMNFSSQNYFSAFFKREMGVSPMQYRREQENREN